MNSTGSNITQNNSCTFVKESEFLHMTRSNFRWPFLKVSFSFNPVDINETSGSIASAETEVYALNTENLGSPISPLQYLLKDSRTMKNVTKQYGQFFPI
jgi:hypothetical protein